MLVSRGIGDYVDETDLRMGDQSSTMLANDPTYDVMNRNAVRHLLLADLDGDGPLDLFMADSSGYIGRTAPLIHLNDGRGVFSALDPESITKGRLYFGALSFSLQMNADARVDFLPSDLQPGADGRFGTPDDYSRLIPTLGVGPISSLVTRP